MGSLALLVLAIVLIAVVVNFFDEPLSAEAKALMTLPVNPYSPDDNLYVAMIGFDAPAGQSVVSTGVARVADYNQSLEFKLAHPTDPAAYIAKTDPNALKFERSNEFCSSSSASIWADAKNHRADIAALLNTNEELYQRYMGLHRLVGYHETAREGVLAPLYLVPQLVRCLFLAQVAMRIQTGSLQQQHAAIDDLSQDLHTWKTMLRGDGGLLSKMIATAWLHRDLNVFADMITDANSDMQLLEGEQRGILTPASLTDWNISNALGAEFRLKNSYFAQTQAIEGNSLQMHFLKYNATQNLIAKQTVELTKLAADPHGFSLAREHYRQWLRENETLYYPTVLFNPIGKVLASLAAPTYEDYLLRTYDVAAFERLVYLAYQIRLRGIASSRIPTFLTQHPEWSTHPVDGIPFRWNSASGELRMDPVGTQPVDRRFSIAVFQQAATS